MYFRTFIRIKWKVCCYVEHLVLERNRKKKTSLLTRMDRILKGVMRYRGTTREQMVKEFKQVKDNPHVSSSWNLILSTSDNHLQRLEWISEETGSVSCFWPGGTLGGCLTRLGTITSRVTFFQSSLRGDFYVYVDLSFYIKIIPFINSFGTHTYVTYVTSAQLFV